MDAIELKFLLKLLGFPDYRAPLSKITPNSKTSASERNKICRQLRDRGLLACAEEVTKLKIAPPGQALLKLDLDLLPITPLELKILKACEKGAITPGKTNVPAAERQALIQSLANRGYIKAAETKIQDVWLTEQAKEYLQNEYSPKGTATITLDMLSNYLNFMRKSLRVETSPAILSASKPNDEEILQTIRDLDRELSTENYLPIFDLRQKLQPPLSREELDLALYRLEEADRIQLSTLAEPRNYTPEQLEAGISQTSGGWLFFIAVN